MNRLANKSKFAIGIYAYIILYTGALNVFQTLCFLQEIYNG